MADPHKARSVSEARRKGLKIPAAGRGAKAPQASRLSKMEEAIKELSCRIDNAFDIMDRRVPSVNREIVATNKLSPPGPLTSAPFKVRLEQIRESLVEHLQRQRSFAGYLNPSPPEDGAMGAAPKPCSMVELFDSIEYLITRISEEQSRLSAQF